MALGSLRLLAPVGTRFIKVVKTPIPSDPENILLIPSFMNSSVGFSFSFFGGWKQQIIKYS